MFAVYDEDCTLEKRFGNIYKDKNMFHQRCKNAGYFAIDSNDDIYFAFLEYPVLRKYNRDHKLVFEKDLSHIPDVINHERNYKKSGRKSTKSAYNGRFFFNDTSFDENNLYLGTIFFKQDSMLRENIYILDKSSGDIEKKLTLQYKNRDRIANISFDFNHPEYFYVLDGTIPGPLKFKKDFD